MKKIITAIIVSIVMIASVGAVYISNNEDIVFDKGYNTSLFVMEHYADGTTARNTGARNDLRLDIWSNTSSPTERVTFLWNSNIVLSNKSWHFGGMNVTQSAGVTYPIIEHNLPSGFTPSSDLSALPYDGTTYWITYEYHEPKLFSDYRGTLNHASVIINSIDQNETIELNFNNLHSIIETNYWVIQPQNFNGVVGQTAILSGQFSSLSDVTYQWQYKTSASGTWHNATAEGNNTNTMIVPASMGRNGYFYRLRATVNGASYLSNEISFTVLYNYLTEQRVPPGYMLYVDYDSSSTSAHISTTYSDLMISGGQFSNGQYMAFANGIGLIDLKSNGQLITWYSSDNGFYEKDITLATSTHYFVIANPYATYAKINGIVQDVPSLNDDIIITFNGAINSAWLIKLQSDLTGFSYNQNSDVYVFGDNGWSSGTLGNPWNGEQHISIPSNAQGQEYSDLINDINDFGKDNKSLIDTLQSITNTVDTIIDAIYMVFPAELRVLFKSFLYIVFAIGVIKILL